MATEFQVKSSAVQSTFIEFERNVVRVPKVEVVAAREVHPHVVKSLKDAIPGVVDTKLVGSWARKTQAAHIKDIDTLLFIDDPDGWWKQSAGRALDRVASVAAGHPMVADAEPRVRAVRVRLKEYPFWIDLVLGIKPNTGEGLWLPRNIPEEGLDDWTIENPLGQVDAAVAKNLQCGGMYVPATRIVKFWNQGAGKPLHSYHVESILWHALDCPVAYPTAVVTFFEAAVRALQPGGHVADPGNLAKFVDDRLELHERRQALEVVSRTLQQARNAAALDGDDALEAWALVMGPGFPAPSNTEAALRAALVAGGATAVTTGIRPVTSGRPVIQPRSWRP